MQSLLSKEIMGSVAVVVFAFLTLNPFHILMSTFFQMCMYGLLLVATALFAGLVARERTLDEREERHRAIAGRIGYVLGLIVLLVGISFQTLSHSPIDAWLVGALVAMVLGKVIARSYIEARG